MSVLKNGDLMTWITDALSILTVNVKLHNSRGRTDVNADAEDFYSGLLSIVLGKKLKNLNLMEMNFAAIDLADQSGRLCVQVTSTEGRDKVDKTLEKFFGKNLQANYDRLIVLIIGEKPNYRKDFDVPAGFSFEPDEDIWDTAKLLKEIEKLNPQKRRAIGEFLESQMKIDRRSEKVLNLPLQSALAEGAFVGREEELAQIGERFESERVVVLSGLGGMGKTELAVRYGRDHEESDRGWAYFLHFSGSFAVTLRANVTRIIPDYSVEGKTDEQIEADALAVLNRCGKEDLLILDNADEGSMTALRRELSKLHMRVLVTTRHRDKAFYKLGSMENEQLYLIFRRHHAALDEAVMDQLIEAVDGHTMTVDLIARTLGSEWCVTSPEEIRDAMTGAELPDDDYPEVETDHERDPEQLKIYGHLRMLFRLQEMKPEEEQALRCAVLLPADGMKMELFLKALPAANRKAIRDLDGRGWIQCEDKLVTIHPVVRLVCRKELMPTDENCGAFLDGLLSQYDPNHYDKEQYRQMAEVFTAAAGLLEDAEGKWALRAGHFWWKLGEAVKALECNEGAVRKLEVHKPDSVDLAGAYNNLGTTYGDLGDPQKEQKYLLKAMEILERELDKDHPILASSYNNVGGAYDKLGDHKKALGYRLKALEIFERVLGADPFDLAISYDDVGSTYSNLGDDKKALKYKLKALEIRKRVQEANQPDLATSYNNVGCTYGDLGDHQKELKYVVKALEIQERVLPGDHPTIAASCGNIAFAYGSLGDFQTAVGYIRRAVEIAEKRLPEGHPDLENYRYGRKLIEQQAMLQEQGIEVPNPFKK